MATDSPAPQTETPKTTKDRASEYAEKALLVPVGVAMTIRDTVVSTVQDFSSPEKATKRISRYERRGAKARKSFERDVRKARKRLDGHVTGYRKDLDAFGHKVAGEFSKRFSKSA